MTTFIDPPLPDPRLDLSTRARRQELYNTITALRRDRGVLDGNISSVMSQLTTSIHVLDSTIEVLRTQIEDLQNASPPPSPVAAQKVRLWTADGGPCDCVSLRLRPDNCLGEPIQPTILDSNGRPLRRIDIARFRAWLKANNPTTGKPNVPLGFAGPGMLDFEEANDPLAAGNVVVRDMLVEALQAAKSDFPDVQWGIYAMPTIKTEPYGDLPAIRAALATQINNQRAVLLASKMLFLPAYDLYPDEHIYFGPAYKAHVRAAFRQCIAQAAELGVPLCVVHWHRHHDGNIGRIRQDGTLENPFARTLTKTAELSSHVENTLQPGVTDCLWWGGYGVERNYNKIADMTEQQMLSAGHHRAEWVMSKVIRAAEFPDGYHPDKVKAIDDHYLGIFERVAGAAPSLPFTPRLAVPSYTPPTELSA